ncbi:probably inactive leucine-rich repeat receptor-like protein kinase At3g28040 [Triticum urartu]|uniref:non-specific serine/threonine protein kinase n=1 Tax=Triticum urartu TaxID=4572 RepID=A0A8R7VJ65_TRIUA|nr:probably inactive leucine-rich repeat receptor-like protein kinase At3g28040 [Triticum urartu]XP_048566246.1 probably inactive leucine-rich repeat receptor-like protein kinase At3g28040 [Triticum urartu]
MRPTYPPRSRAPPPCSHQNAQLASPTVPLPHCPSTSLDLSIAVDRHLHITPPLPSHCHSNGPAHPIPAASEMAAPTTVLLLLLLLLCVVVGPRSAYADVLPEPVNEEVLGLVVFRSALTDPSGALAAWAESDATPCGWPHVECDPATARVLRLALDGLALSSASGLPRGLDRLPRLQSLSLARNNLSGALRPGLSLLPSLRLLDLSRNNLHGPLPDDLPLLASLRYLDLSSNAFSGPLPSSFPPALRFLVLSGNRLSGDVPAGLAGSPLLLHLNLSGNELSGAPDFANALWPLSRLRALDLSRNRLSGPVAPGVGGLHNLKTLDLSGNRFSGAVPEDIGLCPHLGAVDLSDNAFDGELPESMARLASLVRLSASANRLSGAVPAWLGGLAALQHLDLSDNALTGNLPDSLGDLKDLSYLSLSKNRLAGSVPEAMSGCTRLAELHLRGNQLSGSIPDALFDVGLETLDMSSNALTGVLPSGSTRLAETLQWLDLSGNQLTGGIPAEMALFFNLRYLNLSSTDLRTQLPPELGLLRNLTVLDLRSSGLYGPVPGDLCESGSLAVLQLDGNSLAGPIPDNIGKCSSLYLLSMGHNSLTGPIPAGMGELKKLEILRLEDNNLTGEIPQQLGGLESLLAVNISHNRLVGRLPASGVFQSLDASALEGNLGVCSPLVAEPCVMNVPKPLVLDPNEYTHGGNNNDSDLAANGDGSGGETAPRKRRFLSVSAMVAICAALSIVLGVVVIALLNVSARRRRGVGGGSADGLFQGKELELESSVVSGSSTKSSKLAATGKMVTFGPGSSLRTEDFVGGADALLSKATEIGRGGAFGTTYRASVGEGRVVAVKKLSTASVVESRDEFDREARVLGKARHPNLMPLKGYYWTPQLQLLVTDYAPHGSLEGRLHGKDGEGAASFPPLTWAERFRVVAGTARGLAYLHQSFRPPVIHYNLKPSNILLDSRCNPLIADFGLARLLRKPKQQQQPDGNGGVGAMGSCRFMQSAAMGYAAPELACSSLRVNEKCDVYGFGVLVLELVTGRRAVEYGEDDVAVLTDQVRVALEQGAGVDDDGAAAERLVDPALRGEFPEEEALPVLKLGVVCTSQIPSNRPSMAEVVQILQVIRAPSLPGCTAQLF